MANEVVKQIKLGEKVYDIEPAISPIKIIGDVTTLSKSSSSADIINVLGKSAAIKSYADNNNLILAKVKNDSGYKLIPVSISHISNYGDMVDLSYIIGNSICYLSIVVVNTDPTINESTTFGTGSFKTINGENIVGSGDIALPIVRTENFLSNLLLGRQKPTETPSKFVAKYQYKLMVDISESNRSAVQIHNSINYNGTSGTVILWITTADGTTVTYSIQITNNQWDEPVVTEN